MPTPPENLKHFQSLVQLVSDLRGPHGCPWDKQQNHISLTPYAIEETYEMVEALEGGDDAEICEELGDVLFQVVLHAELARERGAFKIEDVIHSISEKIVRRHPHVFSNTKVDSIDDVLKNWDLIKTEEKAGKKPKPLFKTHFPALQTAQKIGEKTKDLKFDWENTDQVLLQLKSEIIELEEALKSKDKSHIENELGDVLFTVAQIARHENIDPEFSLKKMNHRFIQRFTEMLKSCENSIEIFIKKTSTEKENLWKKAKLALFQSEK